MQGFLDNTQITRKAHLMVHGALLSDCKASSTKLQPRHHALPDIGVLLGSFDREHKALFCYGIQGSFDREYRALLTRIEYRANPANLNPITNPQRNISVL